MYRNLIDGSHSKNMFSFVECCQTIFQSAPMEVHYQQWWTRVPVALQPYQQASSSKISWLYVGLFLYSFPLIFAYIFPPIPNHFSYCKTTLKYSMWHTVRKKLPLRQEYNTTWKRKQKKQDNRSNSESCRIWNYQTILTIFSGIKDNIKKF